VNKKKELDSDAAPATVITDAKPSGTSTFLGSDYPGTRFNVIADEGTPVKAGEPVLCDRRHPEIQLTSPISGRVSAVRKGARRSLVSLEITSDGKEDTVEFDIPTTLNAGNIKSLMLRSGLWTSLRSRPFGHLPSPDRSPAALLITAMDTRPLSPDSAIVISKYINELSEGIKVLCDLIDSPIFVCKATNDEYEFADLHRASVVEFSGPHPAGLAGTHIQRLCPIGFNGDEVWHIGYQDVISLGHLTHTGRRWYERVISLAGSAVKNPRLITVPLGASLADITAQELIEEPSRIFSGSVLSGHGALDLEGCLRQRDNQVTAMLESTSESADANNEPQTDSLIPTTDLDSLAPRGILAVPLLRALLVGDVERARDLGALELVEEDLALLSYASASKTDYGPLLRDMLEQMHKEGLSTRD
jgi:Na+-transporting NADH:ubiquinone oxidoreductase subunit A